MTILTRGFCALFTAGMLAATPSGAAERDTLYQYSIIDGLLAGLYEGALTVGDISAHGDFGLGTFNALDGELIVVDGIVFQARGNGATQVAAPGTGVPFVSVTFFDADLTAALPAGSTLSDLETLLDGLAPNQNIFHAIRVDGVFRSLKLRVAPKQSKPFAPLAQVIEQQAVYELTNVRGTLVGLRAPAFLAGLNVPGYHFHFVTADRKRGGHVFELTAARGTIQIDHTAQFTVDLPQSQKFAALDLTQSRHADMRKVEKTQAVPSPLPAIASPKVAPPQAPVVAKPILAVTETPEADQAKKSKAPWAFLFECKDTDVLPDHMRLRNQRHKAARRPANKAKNCD